VGNILEAWPPEPDSPPDSAVIAQLEERLDLSPGGLRKRKYERTISNVLYRERQTWTQTRNQRLGQTRTCSEEIEAKSDPDPDPDPDPPTNAQGGDNHMIGGASHTASGANHATGDTNHTTNHATGDTNHTTGDTQHTSGAEAEVEGEAAHQSSPPVQITASPNPVSRLSPEVGLTQQRAMHLMAEINTGARPIIQRSEKKKRQTFLGYRFTLTLMIIPTG
jgi:hypothetical protein